MLETVFGATLVNADRRTVPVRLIGEQHVRQDLGSIPSFADWARQIAPKAWMLRGHTLDEADAVADDITATGDVFVQWSTSHGRGAAHRDLKSVRWRSFGLTD